MKKFILLFVIGGMLGNLQAQDTISIYDIQFVDPSVLAACMDTSRYLGDTVYTYGVVTMDGGLAQVVNGRNVWIQDGVGPWSGLDVFATGAAPNPVPGVEVSDLVAGDSILIKGFITAFQNETEIVPLEISLISSDNPVVPTPVSVGDLNDANRNNILPTGEQYEGVYVEITDVTVSFVDQFNAGGIDRVSFDVQDAAGNTINVSDRFIVQRLPVGGGTFVAPNIGDRFDTLRGVILHSPNGCLGGGRGYGLNPFRNADYVASVGASSPLISGITRNPVTPSSSQDVTVTATIEDNDGTVTSATLHYTVGVSNTNYFAVPMTGNGSTYTGTIPNTAFSDGDFVKYYLSATDNDTLTSTNPNISVFNPLFFAVRDNGITIFDVQFTPFDDGNSGYDNLEVEVTGIVTASGAADDLGFVYIQQPGQAGWAGLSLVQNAQLANLSRGDEVRVRGTINEANGLTRMENIISVNTLSTGNPIPAAVVANPAVFSSYDFATNELYESMLVQLVSQGGPALYIVDENADDPNNFAEYRVGPDQFDPASGCRVLAGRVASTAFSSLAFSYVNDTTWATNNGVMSVTPCQVTVGDTMASLTGIMTYSFGFMKLLPRNNDDAENYSGANCPTGIGTTGLEAELAGTELTVFPNPTQAELNVRFSFPKMVQGEAVLYDLMGRKVASQAVLTQQGQIAFATTQLSGGTYLLSLEVAGIAIARQKVMIIR